MTIHHRRPFFRFPIVRGPRVSPLERGSLVGCPDPKTILVGRGDGGGPLFPYLAFSTLVNESLAPSEPGGGARLPRERGAAGHRTTEDFDVDPDARTTGPPAPGRRRSSAILGARGLSPR